MSVQSELARLSVSEFRDRIRGEMVPLSSQFSYFVAALPLNEEDLRDYLADPIAALPPGLAARLPRVSILLVPYLEAGNGKDKKEGRADDLVVFERPAEGKVLRSLLRLEEGDAVTLFGVQDMELADYHYELYHRIAGLAAELHQPADLTDYYRLLREELSRHVHGEVDEASWKHKQALMRRLANPKRDSKAFREYALESFVDTLTLYLHGICCDIDVEPGPRQLPSRYLRHRLKLLKSMFAPPEGYAVFPEDQDQGK